MTDLPAQFLPKLTKRQVDELRAAFARVDQIGQVLGTTNLQAKPMLLGELGAVAQAILLVLEGVDRRGLSFRKRYHLLTPEDRAVLAQNADAQTPEGDGAQGD